MNFNTAPVLESLKVEHKHPTILTIIRELVLEDALKNYQQNPDPLGVVGRIRPLNCPHSSPGLPALQRRGRPRPPPPRPLHLPLQLQDARLPPPPAPQPLSQLVTLHTLPALPAHMVLLLLQTGVAQEGSLLLQEDQAVLGVLPTAGTGQTALCQGRAPLSGGRSHHQTQEMEGLPVSSFYYPASSKNIWYRLG